MYYATAYGIFGGKACKVVVLLFDTTGKDEWRTSGGIRSSKARGARMDGMSFGCHVAKTRNR